MDLVNLGWCDAFAQQLPSDHSHWLPARVAVTHRGRYVVYTAAGEREAILTGALLRAHDCPVTGDWVAVDAGAGDGPARIMRLLPRRTAFARRPPIAGGRRLARFEGETRFAGGATAEQVLAANMDLVLLVAGLDGDYSLNRIRRGLVLARCSGAEARVVLNKADLADPGPALAELRGLAPAIAVSAATGAGLEGFAALLRPGRTAVLLGSSGVGKSSLVNALLDEARQYVSPKSAATGKGRHTTSRRELVPLPGGGCLLDTPGLREVQLWAGEEDIAQAFSTVELLALRCRFADCRHDTEPGCAVKAAIEAGTVPDWELAEYRRLTREVRYLALRRLERLRAPRRKPTAGEGGSWRP